MKKDLYLYIKKIKKKYNFKIVDTHVHPFDVMGVVRSGKSDKDYKSKLKQSPFEMLKFSKFSYILADIIFTFAPKIVKDSIKISYKNTEQKRFLYEMDEALVDEAVFLPVEPWSSSREMKKFNSKRFLCLGSVDINYLSVDEIRKELEYQLRELKIVGIKMHPNLQNFKPRPKDNNSEVKEKLETIYKFAEEKNLYLLFHGGLTNLVELYDPKFKNLVRKKTNALLKNFCDKNGESEVFSLNSKIIIAHLGHFGLNKLNKKLLKKIIEKNNNVFFDTSAMGPKIIKEFLNSFGFERLVFGSDAMYNRMGVAIKFVNEAIKKSRIKNKEEVLASVLGKNYYKNIL